MFDALQSWMAAGREAVLAGAGLALLIAVIAVAFTKRSILAAAGTLLFGALLLWGMANSDWLRDKAGEDFDAAAVTEVIVVDGNEVLL